MSDGLYRMFEMYDKRIGEETSKSAALRAEIAALQQTVKWLWQNAESFPNGIPDDIYTRIIVAMRALEEKR